MVYLNDISDVVLLPYKTASQSGIIPTSFIFGNPIIATKVGALVESIQDGKNGILVNAEDAISFSYYRPESDVIVKTRSKTIWQW